MRKFKALETIYGSITEGKVYTESEEYTGNQNCIIIINDSGNSDALFEERFEQVPEPITFTSQEEFENAVMAVVMKRLEVSEKRQGDYYFNEVVFDLWDNEI